MVKEPDPVLKYFRFDKTVNQSKCLLGSCAFKDVTFKGCHVGNLTVHVKRFHKEEYGLLEEEKKSILLLRQEAASARPPRKKRKIIHSVAVKINEKQIVDACLSLVTESGRPLKLLDDKGFRMILDPILDGLDGSLTISAENIVPKVNQTAKEMRDQLKKEMKNRMLCLKVDCAKRLSRSILGFNAQYVNDCKVILRTLSTYELKNRQTGATLKNMILETLGEYNISLSQVYTITTDNGANILLAVKLLSEELGKATENDGRLSMNYFVLINPIFSIFT